MTKKIQPSVLTIAGSDSGGNAGVQADLRVFNSIGIHGSTVFSAMTAQNPFAVSAVHCLPPEFVAAQLEAVLGVYNLKALKTGMLATANNIAVIAEKLSAYPQIAKVIDPVMVATSGARLVDEAAVAELKKSLIPMASIVTPNLPEAEVLCNRPLSLGARQSKVDYARELALQIFEQYGVSVLVKGGHGDHTAAVDVLFDGKEFHEYSMAWIRRPVSTHGTGCSFAAATAAYMALGFRTVKAVEMAKDYVHKAIANSYYVGKNCGVLGPVK